MRLRSLLAFVLLTSCHSRLANNVAVHSNLIYANGDVLSTRITLPDGYTRIPETHGSFAAYLRNTKLKPDGSKVHYYNGAEKPNRDVYVAVVDANIGTQNLLQCADAVMYQRAMYLWHTGRKDNISFTFTNGFACGYRKWRDGYRVAVNGNKAEWVDAANTDTSYTCFRKYLDEIFSYCGTLSLSRELEPVTYKDLQPGDVLIIGGSPGHAELVMDMAADKAGHKIYLLSQGYMPAQDIQILANPTDAALNPWYMLDTNERIIFTPECKFSVGSVKRFASLKVNTPN